MFELVCLDRVIENLARERERSVRHDWRGLSFLAAEANSADEMLNIGARDGSYFPTPPNRKELGVENALIFSP